MDKKLNDKIVKEIEWSHSTQGGWEGAFILKDGYRISWVMPKEIKMREAKSFIKEHLPQRVVEVASERHTEVF